MKTLFNISVFIQAIVTVPLALIMLTSVSSIISGILIVVMFSVSLFASLILLNYAKSNDIFKSIEDLRDEKTLYQIEKQKYADKIYCNSCHTYVPKGFCNIVNCRYSKTNNK